VTTGSESIEIHDSGASCIETDRFLIYVFGGFNAPTAVLLVRHENQNFRFWPTLCNADPAIFCAGHARGSSSRFGCTFENAFCGISPLALLQAIWFFISFFGGKIPSVSYVSNFGREAGHGRTEFLSHHLLLAIPSTPKWCVALLHCRRSNVCTVHPALSTTRSIRSP